MSWETRKNGNSYYYHKERVNGRVVSRYIGNGPLAQFLATADAETARAAAQRRSDFETEQQEFAEIEQTLDRMDQLIKLLIDAVLLASGYHTHKGQWRYTRHKSKH